MPTDTLTFLPGDSASCDGWVVVTDGQGRVMPNQEVSITLLEPFGSVELINGTDSTDAAGRVYFRFRSYNATGVTTVRAAVGTKTDLWQLTVLPARAYVSHLNLTLSKRQMSVSSQFEDSLLVTCTISDSANLGVPGIILPVRCNGGRLLPIGPTDATGKASTWWYSNGQYGMFTIWVAIDTLRSEDSVRVDSLYRKSWHAANGARRRGKSRPTTGSRDRILTVTLKDQYGSAIIGDTIKFSAPEFGSVKTNVVTDSFGVANSYFQSDVASLSSEDSAMVIVRYPRLGLADTVNIHVSEAAEVGWVTVSMNPMTGIAGVDTARVLVRAFYADGNPINGLLVMTVRARAARQLSILWIMVRPNSPGSSVIRFRRFRRPRRCFVTVIGTAISDTASPTIIAGPPRRLNMTVSPPRILIGETANVWADVTDSLGNRVGLNEATVVFTTTLGTVSPLMVGTNSQGRAECTLSPSTQAGNAIVTAMTIDSTATDSKLLIIDASDANSIRLTVSNPSPQVIGTGGIDQTHACSGSVRCQSESRARRTGGMVRNHGAAGWQQRMHDQQPRHAGLRSDRGRLCPGHVQLRLASWPGGDRSPHLDGKRAAGLATATANNINIVAGPPRHIQIQASNDAIDASPGDASWTVPLVAVVTDTFANPVGEGVAVFFSLLYGVGDDTASVQSDTVYTGNGAGQLGTAYSALRYIAAATGETVIIQAETAGSDAVVASIAFVLPLQSPTINLYCMPATWHFQVDGAISRIECMSLVRDGFRTPVNNIKVIYSTTRGRFFLDENGTPPSQSYRRTGPVYSGNDTV